MDIKMQPDDGLLRIAPIHLKEILDHGFAIIRIREGVYKKITKDDLVLKKSELEEFLKNNPDVFKK